MLTRYWLIAAAIAPAFASYLALWPVSVRPVAWSAPEAPGYIGVHAVNDGLTGLRMIDLGPDEGPENVLLGPDGKLYAAVASGKILRMAPDGSGRQVLAATGGRVLGFAFARGSTSRAPRRTKRQSCSTTSRATPTT